MTMAHKLAEPQPSKANTVKKTFSRETCVDIQVYAQPIVIWRLLTDAAGYPRWNSTVISIEGNIAPGEKIRLKPALDPKRIFKLKVKEFHAERKLVWGDAMGKRINTPGKTVDRSVTFSMTEKIDGPLFPFFGKMIPAFDKSFDQFAIDLKKEAERIMTEQPKHKYKKMKIVKVIYTTRPEFVDQNQMNIRNVMTDLQRLHYAGINYNCCMSPDGKTFTHTAFFKAEDDQKLLNELPSFKHFQQELKSAGFEVAPKQELLTLVGSSIDIFGLE